MGGLCCFGCFCRCGVKAVGSFPPQQEQPPWDALCEQDAVAWRGAVCWGAASVEGTLEKVP